MKKRTSRGIAPIVSWILLLGFAIGLATLISLWQIDQTEDFGSSVIRYASGIMDCNELSFNVYSSDGCNTVKIKNSGYFSIDGFVVRSFSGFGAKSDVKEVFVKAQESGELEFILVSADRIEVMPIVDVEGEMVGCKDKVIESSCDGLTELQEFTCEQADPDNCGRLDGTGVVTCEECCENLEKCCVC
ncbi:MAG: hypothetical protein KKA79_01520 [Nanoarchaeota archaeon]|nr:hypothetical protein [Nanoarchaeota archaeon]